MTTIGQAAFLAISLGCASIGAQPSIRQIEIDSRWGGLGPAGSFHCTIRAEGGLFLSEGARVDAAKVRALVEALGAPPKARPTLQNLGLTPEWLGANARRLLGERNRSFAAEAQNIQELQIAALSDAATVQRLLPQIFDGFHTDDYPTVQAVVTFDDATTVSARSEAQGPYMLPWIVKGKSKTYDASIARAVVGLMPANAVNRDRLAGEGLGYQLAETVQAHFKEHITTLDAENRAGDALNVLRGHFTVREAEVNPYHGPAYGKALVDGRHEETNLHTLLHRAGFPENLVTAGVFLHENGRTSGINGFLSQSGKYESLVMSTPWLLAFLWAHQGVRVEILYVHDKSFGDHAFETFAKDMKARRKPELIERVRSQQGDIALLAVLGRSTVSYWLLFPDHSMLLWRYEGHFDLLKWKPADFGEPRCGDYNVNNGGCPAAEVTVDGKLVMAATPDDAACVAAFRAASSVKVSQGEPLFPVHAHGRGGFIDRSGTTVIPECFDAVGVFSEGLASFERNGRWGYIDRAGGIIIQPRFMWAHEFSDGLARVQLDGPALGINTSWGFIDKAGRVVIRLKRDQTGYGTEDEGFHEGLALVGGNRKVGYIDRSGKLAIPMRYGSGTPFHDGIAAVSADVDGERWGFIDKTGRWIIPPRFDWASLFEEGLAAVNRKRDCGFIDQAGTLVLKPPIPEGETDCATVWGSFHDGLARWRFGRKFGYIDRTGRTVIDGRFDLTSGFSEGLAAVQIGGRWGYIDTVGRMVVEPRDVQVADPFRNGLAHIVTKDGKHGYIDKSGKDVWAPQKQDDE